ncbi:ribonuclease P protein component [Paracoccaceae bacterium GXU_MW_L88]
MAAPDILKKRQDFLAAARARKQGAPAFLLQARETGGPMRVGFTCSKKVGNAVARNRAKRRLRAIAREVLPTKGRTGWDYVLIGKAGDTAQRPYEKLKRDLERALERIHAKP